MTTSTTPEHGRRYKKRKAAGLCVDCSHKSVRGKVRCGVCAKKNRLSKGPGKCRDCGKKTESSRCTGCMEKVRRNYRRRIENGYCAKCNARATAGAFCFRHWIQNIGRNYGLSWKNGGLGMIEQLWREQGGKCTVTRAELIPGYNASLDHIVPRSKGGDSSVENLRWTLLSVNRAKMDLDHHQFVEMCRLVISVEDETVESTPSLQLVVGGK